MVTIYTKNRCPNCDKSKKLMNRLGIDYEEISIEQTPGALEKIISMGFQAAPVILTEDDSWAGLNEGKIRNLAVLDDVWLND